MAPAAVGLFCACEVSAVSLGWEMMGGSNHVGVRTELCLLERSGPVGQTCGDGAWTDCH